MVFTSIQVKAGDLSRMVWVNRREGAVVEGRKPPMSETLNIANARKAIENGQRSKPETPGERFGRLIRQAVVHTVAMQDSARDPNGQAYQAAKEGLATVHDEFRARCLHGNEYDSMLQAVFDMRVQDRVIAIHEDRRDRRRAEKLGEVIRQRREAIAGDWPIIHREFPGQFDDLASE